MYLRPSVSFYLTSTLTLKKPTGCTSYINCKTNHANGQNLASVKTEGSIAASRGDKRLTTGAIPVHCACEFKKILPAL